MDPRIPNAGPQWDIDSERPRRWIYAEAIVEGRWPLASIDLDCRKIVRVVLGSQGTGGHEQTESQEKATLRQAG